MRTIVLAFVFIGFIATKTNAQQLILTGQQNDAWYANFYKAPLNQKVELLKARLLADTNVFVENKRGDIKLPKTDIEKHMATGIHKPFVSVLFGKGVMYSQGPYIKNNNKVKAFCSMLNVDNIQSIEIPGFNNSVGKPASNGMYGMIILRTKSKNFADAVMVIDRTTH